MPALRHNRPRLTALWMLAGLALMAGLLAGAAERAGAASVPPLRTGVSYVYGNDPADFQHVVAAGAKQVMTPLRWREIAPQSQPSGWDPANPADPNYDWGSYDLWVGRAIEAGLTPVLQVRGAPDWAQACPLPGWTDAPCKIDSAALTAFATAAATRYSGRFQGLPRVRYWQGLNEPNLYYYFRPQFEGGKAVSPVLYRKLLNAFTAAIKSVNRSNVAIAAGLGPLAIPGKAIGPLKFTRELLCMRGRKHPRPLPGNCEGGVHFDVFDMHPYTSGGPTHQGPNPDDVELGDIPELMELLRAANRAGRIKSNQFKRTPLWILEMSWDSNPPDPTGLPMRIGMQWIPEALYRTWKAGVRNFSWFTISDFDPNPPGGGDVVQSGLYFFAPSAADQQPKPIVAAFRFPFVAFPKQRKGMLVWGRTPTSRGGRVAVEARKGGKWRRVAVVRAGGNGVFTAMLNSRYGSDKKGSVRATFRDQASPEFPMNPVGDFFQPPFGFE